MNTMNEGGNSLLSVIDRTISPMGANVEEVDSIPTQERFGHK